MNKKYEYSDIEWLRKMADVEDRFDSISVGGLVSDLGMLRPAKQEKINVFGVLVKFARRRHRMSVDELATKADVDLAELVAIERASDVTPTPRTVFQLANTLKLSTSKLMVLAGLAETKDENLSQAALRFAAKSEPTAKLTKSEREAYEEFVKVLADTTDGG